MNLTLSPQIKVLALVGVLAAVGLMASMTLLGGKEADPNAGLTVATRPAVTPPAPAPAKPAATTPAKPAGKPRTTPKPAVEPAAPAKPVKPVQRGNLVYETLPKPLQWALSQHEIVVVSTYNPKADVDAIAVAEAHAGADDAGVGFLLVSVLDNAVAGPLTALLPGGGLLPDPGVLVYRAPGNLALRIDGFADRTVVAQAATNAMAGENGPVAASASGVLP